LRKVNIFSRASTRFSSGSSGGSDAELSMRKRIVGPGVVRAAGRVGEASKTTPEEATGDGEAGRGARGVGAAASAGATRKASERRDAPTAMGCGNSTTGPSGPFGIS
jgi:hypothetical protein